MKKNQPKDKGTKPKYYRESIHYAPLSEFNEDDYDGLDKMKKEYPGISREEIAKHLSGWKCFKEYV
jgi:hypothetical protein